MDNESNTPVQESQADSSTDNTQSNLESQETNSEVSSEATPAEVKAEIKRLQKLKLKVDGEEYEESLPFEVEDKPEVIDYLKKQLQLAKVSQKRMAHASSLEKEIGTFLQALQQNPEEVLSDPNLQIDLEALAKRIIEKKIEQSKKTPEQIEQEKLQARLKELEDQNKQKEEALRQKEMEYLQEKMTVQYTNDIQNALKKANLPVNSYMTGRVAGYLYQALQNNMDLKAEDIIPQVQKDIQAELSDMFNVMPSEALEAMLGKDAIKKFQKKSPVQQKQPVTPASVNKVADTGGKKEDSEKKEEKMSLNKYFKGMGF